MFKYLNLYNLSHKKKHIFIFKYDIGMQKRTKWRK